MIWISDTTTGCFYVDVIIASNKLLFFNSELGSVAAKNSKEVERCALWRGGCVLHTYGHEKHPPKTAGIWHKIYSPTFLGLPSLLLTYTTW